MQLIDTDKKVSIIKFNNLQFKDLKLIAPILKALDASGYQNPTPIQEQAIPIIFQRKDLLACAQTGTGKTAAFAIPILQMLTYSKEKTAQKRIRTLVLTPTRELAIQIKENFDAYSKELPIRNLVIYGGVGQQPQRDALRKGIDILIATPGRLLDLYNQGFIDLKQLEYFVLDEADRMLDMGFIHDVKKVISIIPKKRQTLLFSATMPAEIQKLASHILEDPSKVEVTPESTPQKKYSSPFILSANQTNVTCLRICSNPKILNIRWYSPERNMVLTELLKIWQNRVYKLRLSMVTNRNRPDKMH